MSPPVGKVVLKLFISGLVKTVEFSRENNQFSSSSVSHGLVILTGGFSYVFI